MKSEQNSRQNNNKVLTYNPNYLHLLKPATISPLETSADTASHRSKDFALGLENVYENTMSPNDFKIHESSTKSHCAKPINLNIFSSRNLLNIGPAFNVNADEKNQEEGTCLAIKNMDVSSKMNNANLKEYEENMLNSYSKLFISKSKKTIGPLKPLRDLRSPEKKPLCVKENNIPLEKAKEPPVAPKDITPRNRTEGEPKVCIDSERFNIVKSKNDYPQTPEPPTFEDENKEIVVKDTQIPKKEPIKSPTLKPEPNRVLKEIQNYEQGITLVKGDVHNKPRRSMSVKKTKFQENLNHNVFRKHTENLKSPKPSLKNLKPDKSTKIGMKIKAKESSNTTKPKICLSNLEVPNRPSKRPEHISPNLFSAPKREGINHTRRKNEKNYGEYFKNKVIFKHVLSFLCCNSLTQMERVSKHFRTFESLSLIRKFQSKLIIRGLTKKEQYEFWNLKLKFTYLQQTYPLQFQKNANKQSLFERDILNDVDRTRIFNHQVTERKDCMLKVLFALSNSMPHIGYVQGLNSIVAVFLSQDLKDYEVYWLVKYILKKKRFDRVFSEGFPMVQLLNYQLEIYIKNYLPEILDFLDEKGLNISYFTAQWFITMFSYDLDLPYLLKIWNLFLIKGWKAIIRISLALLWCFKDNLRATQVDDIPYYLKNFVRENILSIPEKNLFQLASTFKVSNRLLKTLETLYEHSAPSNVILTTNPDQKLEWKIASDRSLNKNKQSTYKTVVEYLNEDIDHMKNTNKNKGGIYNELDNYRSVQINQNPNSITNRQSVPAITRNQRINLHGFENAQITDKSNPSSQTLSGSENSFLQTLTGLGVKLKQILTPKSDNSPLTRKFSDVKVLHQSQINNMKETAEPLSERPYNKKNPSDKANLKFDSANNSVEVSSFTKSGDMEIAFRGTVNLFGRSKPVESVIGATRNNTESSVEKTNLTESPFNAAKFFGNPNNREFKHKKNSSLTSDQLDGVPSFRKPHISNFDQHLQDRDNNLSISENEDLVPAALTSKGEKGLNFLRKNIAVPLTSRDLLMSNKSSHSGKESSLKNSSIKY